MVRSGPNGRLPGAPPALGDQVFEGIRSWIYETAGIHLSRQKKPLVVGRLASRLRHHRLGSYGEYLDLIQADPEEAQKAVDLLTTNETYFFRELKHFDYLRDVILPTRPAARAYRAWSAASSSGEEAYSIAMTLAAGLGVTGAWEVLASDLSTRVLDRARTGHYALSRVKDMPRAYLADYCLRGIGARAGTLLVKPELRTRVQFRQINLVTPLPDIGDFDVIFLRNVMIYFDMPTKQRVVARLCDRLRPGGYLFIGHSESLHGVNDQLKTVVPAIYRKQ
jgi:chemotaxis protein methyltransferase CheR